MKKFTEELTNKEPNRELQSDEYFHDSDHLIYCAKCHTPRQGRYTLQGRVFMPPIRCKCQQELYEQEETKRKLLEKQAEIDKIIGVKQEIIEALNQEFSKEKIAINIDQQTGAIVFDASILYDRSKSELKGEGIQFLDRFLPIYIGVLFSSEFKDDIAEIIIEGHTDTDSGYMYNLGLSQDRALSVVEYCLSDSSLSK